MKSQSTKNPVRIIPCGALFESYGQTLDPSKYCPELPEAQCMLAEGVGFEPTIRNYRIPDFVRRIRPLCHPSASREKMDCICAYKKKQGRRPRKAFPCSTASLSLAERQYITSPPERSFPCRSCRDAAPQESSRNHRHSDSFPTQPRAYGRQRDRNH